MALRFHTPQGHEGFGALAHGDARLGMCLCMIRDCRSFSLVIRLNQEKATVLQERC